MTVRSIRSARKPRFEAARAARPSEAGTILELGPTGDVTVQVAGEDVAARLAEIPGYRASVGDLVVVAWIASDEDRREAACVVAVLRASRAPSLLLADGSRAELVGGGLELRDGEGRLLVRYADGAATVAAPNGDLTLAAPKGAVVIKAASDVRIDAPRDLTQRAGRRVEIAAGADGAQLRVDPAETRVSATSLVVDARKARVATGDATIFARAISTTAQTLAVNVERYELTATRIVERARDAFRDVADLFQMRSRRLKTLVSDDYTVHTRRTVMESKDDTTIDGKKILIG